MVIRLFCACLLFCALSLPCHAADNLPMVIATLEQGYGLLKDLQADIFQRATIAGIKGETRMSGQFFLKKGKDGASPLFRFNYVKPQQQVVSNGKTVWYYLPESKQVMVSDMAGMASGDTGAALSLLTGFGAVSRDFTSRLIASGRDGDYVLELVPRQANGLFSKMQLTVSAAAVEALRAGGKATDPFPVRSTTVFDMAGGRNTMEFSNIRTNRGMDNRRFTFTPPAGVEIIRQ